jgi:hypothetical protein
MKGDFKVTVNGTPADYFRVNNAFKGVLVGAPGSYHVEFAYWPRDLTFSLWLAAAGVIALLILMWLAFFWKPTAVSPLVHSK